jgi:adenylate kinase
MLATQRSDDREEIVRERLQVYKTQTRPLLDFYEVRKILQRVPGAGSIDDVFHLILPLVA